MTKWEPRGVRSNVYWWRSVLYTLRRRSPDYTGCYTTHYTHSSTQGTIICGYIQVHPPPAPTREKRRSQAAACKFMLIEAQEMWEHFLLTFNKHKQTTQSWMLCSRVSIFIIRILGVFLAQKRFLRIGHFFNAISSIFLNASLELVGLCSLLFLNFLTCRGGEEERRRGGESVRCEELN